MDNRFPENWRVDWDRVPAALVEVIRAAVGAIGIAELPVGSNRGPEIDRWNAAVGADLGSRWCAAFVFHCYSVTDPNPLPRTASVERLLEWARANGKLVHSGALQPGDVFLIDNTGPTGEEHRHTGIVVADLGDGRAACCEGNHGNRVAATVRPGTDFTAIARVVEP